MKKTILLFLLTMLIFAKVNSQPNVVIGNLTILPVNYMASDTIKVVMPVTTLSSGINLGHALYINSSQIIITACYLISSTTGISNFIDTDWVYYKLVIII
jgi:hypothetical protein